MEKAIWASPYTKVSKILYKYYAFRIKKNKKKN